MDEFTIKDFLLANGIKPHLKGFDYLATAVELYDKKKNVVSWLYIRVAEKHNTTPQGCERAIRHCMKSSNVTGTNSEVIARFNYQIKRSG